MVRRRNVEELLLVIQAAPRVWTGDLVALSLGAYYLFATDASSTSKTIVAALFLVSLAALFVKPNYWLWVLLSHVAMSIYIVFYLIWKKAMSTRN